MRVLLLSDQGRFCCPGREDVVERPVAEKVASREARDERGLCADGAQVVHHRGEVRAHRLWGRDFLVVVPELEGHVGVFALGDLVLDDGD